MRAAEGIGHNQQLHEMLIHRVAGRLQQEHVFATDILANLDKNLPITKIGHFNATQGNIQILADPPCQLGIRTPCEESQVRHDWLPYAREAVCVPEAATLGQRGWGGV